MLYRLIFCFLLLFISNVGFAKSLETAIMPGEVVQGHAKYEEECTTCHKRFDKAGQNAVCADCHKSVKKDIAEKTGYHGREAFNKNCKDCHTEHKGRKADITNLDKKTFKHNLTDFPLKDAHAKEKVKCKDCHADEKKKYREVPNTCATCHIKDDEKAHGKKLGDKCESCHTQVDWTKTLKFDHNDEKFAKFKLNGKHKETKCKECHNDFKYKPLEKTCISCHKKDDEKAHKNVFGDKCEKCHSETKWDKDLTFDHNDRKYTKFDLEDKHKETKCNECHKKPKEVEELQTTCISCHKKDDKHKGSLGEKCADCHNAKDWKDQPGFDHNKDTKFPLYSKHKDAKCKECHTTGLKFEKVAMNCYSCHKRADEDKGHKGNYGEKCEKCHKETKWKESIFNHDKDTKYILNYKHKDVKCNDCHNMGKLYEHKLTDKCFDCHKKTDDDKGHKGNLGKDCEKCHNEKGWKEVDFDHDKDTKYPLKWKHKDVKCAECHTAKNNYREKTPTDCYSCHKKTDDEKGHKGSLGKDCAKCHIEKAWKEVDKFDHSKTKFPLLGKHTDTKCHDCHKSKSGDFKEVKKDCYSCHKKEDKHNMKLGTVCEACHNARDWKVWDFNHNDRAFTKFDLDGKHKKIDCLECHTTPVVGKKLPATTTCYSCHDKDDEHEGTFGKQCDKCHTTDSFKNIKIEMGK